MFIIGTIVIVFAAVFASIYANAAYKWFAARKTQKALADQLKLLPQLYDQCMVCIETKLGEGQSHNAGIPFSQAHRNQGVAMETIIPLTDTLEE